MSSASLELDDIPYAPAVDRFFEDGGGSRQGTADDLAKLAHLEEIEIQALVGFIGEPEGWRPRESRQTAARQLLREILDGPSNNGAVALILRGESESRLHTRLRFLAFMVQAGRILRVAKQS